MAELEELTPEQDRNIDRALGLLDETTCESSVEAFAMRRNLGFYLGFLPVFLFFALYLVARIMHQETDFMGVDLHALLTNRFVWLWFAAAALLFGMAMRCPACGAVPQDWDGAVILFPDKCSRCGTRLGKD